MSYDVIVVLSNKCHCFEGDWMHDKSKVSHYDVVVTIVPQTTLNKQTAANFERVS